MVRIWNPIKTAITSSLCMMPNRDTAYMQRAGPCSWCIAWLLSSVASSLLFWGKAHGRGVVMCQAL